MNDSLILVLMGDTPTNVTTSFPINRQSRRALFIAYLKDNEWFTNPVHGLSDVLDEWEVYIALPYESLYAYDDIKKKLDNIFPNLSEELYTYTTFLHQTSFLDKHGITDSSDFDRSALKSL